MMNNKSYELLVKEGQELLKKDERLTSEMCWAWGDLALQVVPMVEGEGRNRGVEQELHRWASDIGWFAMGRKLKTLLDYRYVAAAWLPASRLAGSSFGAHMALRTPDKQYLLTDGMTRGEARIAAGHNPPKPPKSIAEEKARDLGEAAHEVNEDKEAQAEAAKDPEIRQEIRTATDNIYSAQLMPKEKPTALRVSLTVEHELRQVIKHIGQINLAAGEADQPGEDPDILDLFRQAKEMLDIAQQSYEQGKSIDTWGWELTHPGPNDYNEES